MPTRDEFREAAKRKLAALPCADVPLWANVQEMADGGAFVECMIWIAPADVAKKDEPKRG